MVDLECPGQGWSARVLMVICATISTALAQPVSVSPRWLATFPAAPGGKAAESTAVSMADGSLMVVVVSAGADPAKTVLTRGSREVSSRLIGHDPVSRLAFLKILDPAEGRPTGWNEEAGAGASANLQVTDGSGDARCSTTGWVKQVGGKILPLALLRVNFSRAVPPPGTPLLDDSGRVTGIVFQSSGSGNTGYAIPAEAVHRVQRDICNGGRLKRGWLGLALRAESPTPLVSRVLPDSPASAAGIRPQDVLLGVDGRPISDYADAANAFFYLIPGRPVKVKLLRDAEQIEYSLVPVASRQ